MDNGTAFAVFTVNTGVMQNHPLNGKTIVITGASSGAGRMTALQFARYRTCLVLAGRNTEALNETAEQCRNSGSETLVHQADTGDYEAIKNLVQAAKNWKGSIHVWVNNAGVLAAGAFDSIPMELHEKVIRTNLLGYLHGAHAVLPVFKDQGYGTLINNISVGGYLPVPYGSGYSASKFGALGFFEALKGELTDWPHIHICDLFPALPQISQIRAGMCQVFIRHTSASLTINENADPTVRKDFEMFFNKTVKENDPDYVHDYEGSDDMPAHLKASLLGSSVMVPIRNGELALGTWQGIYLCEHRNQGGERSLVVTAWGD